MLVLDTVGNAMHSPRISVPHTWPKSSIARSRRNLQGKSLLCPPRGATLFKMRLKMAATSDGKITAAELEAYADGGAYASYGGCDILLSSSLPGHALRHTKPQNRNPSIVHQQTPCGPKRGHGALQPRFAIEMHIDALADKLGHGSRRTQAKEPDGLHPQTANGLKVYSMGLKDCIEAVLKASDYHHKRQNLPPQSVE